jgi:hypothetical protein
MYAEWLPLFDSMECRHVISTKPKHTCLGHPVCGHCYHQLGFRDSTWQQSNTWYTGKLGRIAFFVRNIETIQNDFPPPYITPGERRHGLEFSDVALGTGSAWGGSSNSASW